MIKNQLNKNLLTNVLSLIINVALGIFYIPYLIKNLGIAAYGIVPLALIINQYINVLTGALTGSLTRFYSISLQQEKIEEASQYLSTAMSTILALIILMLPFSFAIIIYVDSIFNIPLIYVENARLLFAFTLLSFFLSLISSLLNITLYAMNRLDLMNVIKIARILFKVILVVILFEKLDKSIEYIGIANLIAELLVLFLSIYYFIYTVGRKVWIKINYFNKPMLLSVLGMTSWILITQFGDIGSYRVDTILVNLFWGTKESGILGALSDFGNFIMSIITVISSLFGPLILIAYSKSNHEEVKSIVMRNTLLVGLISACSVGLIIGFSEEIIILWIGKEFTPYTMWLVLKVVSIPFFMAGGMFAFVFRAWNKIKISAIFTILLGLINLLGLLIIYNYGIKEIQTITYSLIFSSSLIIVQTYLFGIWYLKRIYPEINYVDYFGITISILLTMVIVIIVGKVYIFLFIQNISIIELLKGLFVVGTCGLIFVYVFILNKEQKQYLYKIIHSLRHRNV